MTKCPEEKQVKEKRVYFGLWFQRDYAQYDLKDVTTGKESMTGKHDRRNRKMAGHTFFYTQEAGGGEGRTESRSEAINL